MRKNDDLYVRIALFVIIIMGFLLRINHWFDFLGADEIGKTGLMTWSWDFHKDPFPVHYYPPLFLYLNFVFSIILNKLTIFLGIIDFNNVFQNTDFGFIFTLKTGRLLSAVFGTFNIYMVFKIGKDFFNKYTGLCAALLLSVFWPHVIDSHNFKSDILLTLLITIVVYYTLKFNRTKNKWDILAASFFLGLSIASKFNGAFFGFILIVPLFYLRKEIGVIRNLFYIAAGTAAGFFAGAPNWLVHPVSNVKVTLKYLKGLSDEVLWYDPFPSSFVLYGKNLLEHFGLILLVILICGLIFSFFKKNREGIIISFFILIYFLLAGFQNYLNYRAILPIIPLIVIIIGKLIFSDIREMIKAEKIRAGIVIILLIPVFIYSIGNFNRSFGSFDLLKGIASHPVRERAGIGNPDHSYYFMKYHFDSGSRIFREMWTPPSTGFKGSMFGRDVTRAPERMFSRENGFNFLITSFSTDYILRKSMNTNIINAAKKRLRNYLPFHTIMRPAIFTWSDDITFWYRKPDYLIGNLRPDTGLLLPRSYVPETEDPSVHLPLQRYEKDSRYGIVKNGIAGKHIFSARRIEKIRFSFPEKEKQKLIFKINGKEKVHIAGGGEYSGSLELSGINHKSFGKTAIRRLYEANLDEDDLNKEFFIYRIEVRANTSDPIPFVFDVEYGGEKPGNKIYYEAKQIGSVQRREVTPLFGNDPVPAWLKTFYKRTGIDLMLLSYMNSLNIFDNKENSIDNLSTEYIPVSFGVYRIHIQSEKIVKDFPSGENCELKIMLISGNVKNELSLNIKDGSSVLEFSMKQKKGFYKISCKGAGKSNLLIKKITAVPAYDRYEELPAADENL